MVPQGSVLLPIGMEGGNFLMMGAVSQVQNLESAQKIRYCMSSDAEATSNITLRILFLALSKSAAVFCFFRDGSGVTETEREVCVLELRFMSVSIFALGAETYRVV